ncbi:hypothetical protein [Microbispora sp. H10949]|uniref:hypothetical protein n=1 Tax=Microbispora sp. H10949 TaxID=2729111 RepID=UPI001601A7AC|nr:hypothetical protein [Microbispora sp. H10949]
MATDPPGAGGRAAAKPYTGWPSHPAEAHPVEAHPVEAHPVEAHPVEAHPVEAHTASAGTTILATLTISPFGSRRSTPGEGTQACSTHPKL